MIVFSEDKKKRTDEEILLLVSEIESIKSIFASKREDYYKKLAIFREENIQLIEELKSLHADLEFYNKCVKEIYEGFPIKITHMTNKYDGFDAVFISSPLSHQRSAHLIDETATFNGSSVYAYEFANKEDFIIAAKEFVAKGVIPSL